MHRTGSERSRGSFVVTQDVTMQPCMMESCSVGQRCSREQVRQGWGMGWYTLLGVLLGVVQTDRQSSNIYQVQRPGIYDWPS